MKKKYTSVTLTSIILLISLVLINPASQAQNKPVRKVIREKIEAKHIAFITEKLNLTPEESREFWPVYNEYAAKRKEINKQYAGKVQKMRGGIDNLSDAELKELLDTEIDLEQLQLNLRKEYHAKFKSILPDRKVIQLYQAERQFKKMLMKRVQEFKEERR